jgi:predicted glycosyltransferase
MKILIYLGHPAQYHFFKLISAKLRLKNNTVIYIIKTKDVLEELMAYENEQFINILPEGRKSSKSGIFYGLLKRDLRLFKIVKNIKPDIMIGSDPSIAHIGKLFNIPVLTVLEDDYKVIPQLALLTFPFSQKIVAPGACDCGKWNYKKISYAGYMKLAYLHPNYFNPKLLTINKYFLIRLAKLDAHHDFGINGIDKDLLRMLISELIKYGEVKLLSEAVLDVEFSKYILNIDPNEIHQYLYNSELLISDSQSMSMEAAMLGIPSIRFSDFAGRIGVLEELEHKYGLTYGIKTNDPDKLIAKVKELLAIPDLKEEFIKRRSLMLSDKIDVTAFFVWLIDNYPGSIKELERNPEIQYQFK